MKAAVMGMVKDVMVGRRAIAQVLCSEPGCSCFAIGHGSTVHDALLSLVGEGWAQRPHGWSCSCHQSEYDDRPGLPPFLPEGMTGLQ